MQRRGLIDLDTLEPHLVGPHTPDLARPLPAEERRVAVAGDGPPWSPATIGYNVDGGSCPVV